MNKRAKFSLWLLLIVVVVGVLFFVFSKDKFIASSATPLVPRANLLIEVIDEDGNEVSEGKLVLDTSYAPESGVPGFSYEIDLATEFADDNLLYWEPVPADRFEQLALHVETASGLESENWIIDNKAYWKKYSFTSWFRSYVYKHTFVIPDKTGE